MYKRGVPKSINAVTMQELKERAALTLEDKIKLSTERIVDWYTHFNGKICVNFSGGKDSTALLHLARSIYPNIPAVYLDNSLDFPEVRDFALSQENVIRVTPELKFPQVINKYGFVFPSKEVANTIYYARRGSTWAIESLQGLKNGQPNEWRRSHFVHWRYLLDAPFTISQHCCRYMKEMPMDKWQKINGYAPMLGLLHDESYRRQMAYLHSGCNAYDAWHPSSRPIMFWTEQDVLKYLYENHIPISPIYGEIVKEYDRYRTTWYDRSGCMCCLIGCHLQQRPNKFEKMKQSHPNRYDYFMNQLRVHEALDWLKIPH